MKRATDPSVPVHKWRFRRAGRTEQVVLQSGQDLLNLDTLDQKLWVALSCPTQGLEFDRITLELIDSDKDGRIRPPELIAALKWAGERLENADSLLSGEAALPLKAISQTHANGVFLVSAARRILASLGKPDAENISVEEAHQATTLFTKLPFNGDGVVPASAAEDPETEQLIKDIISTVGGALDSSGEIGITQAKIDEFYREITSFQNWWRAGETKSSGSDRLPLGAETPEGYESFRRVKEKIDDFFFRCRLGEYDPRAISYLNRSEKEYADLAAKNLVTVSEELASRPLATIGNNRPLPLVHALNPAWKAAMTDFRENVILPLLGKIEELPEQDWISIKTKFSDYESWLQAKQGASVEDLGLSRIEEILQKDLRGSLEELINRDLERADEAAALQDLDRLARYHRDLFRLTRNFVSFADFFSRHEEAIFQAGILYLDSRSCKLCVQVNDPNAHSVLAGLSRCYIAYCECKRAGSTPMKIAAVFSNGDSDNLLVGRNGIFYDRQGRDWDATIVRIVENPISIRQAFWAPYKKFVRFIDEQLAKRAALVDEATTKRMAAAAEKTASADQAPIASSEASRRIDVGTVAALGVALGSIGTFLTVILMRMIEFGPWLPVALVGIILLISCPSMLLAWLKLRQRTLGPILDASGWAINGRVAIGVKLARRLTGIQRLPPGSTRELRNADDDATSGKRLLFWFLLLLLAAAILGYYGYQNDWFHLPESPVNEEPVPEQN